MGWNKAEFRQYVWAAVMPRLRQAYFRLHLPTKWRNVPIEFLAKPAILLLWHVLGIT